MDFWAIFDFWRNLDFFEKIKIHFLAITFYPDIQITWFLHRWVSFFVIFPGTPIMAIVLVIGLMIKYGQYGQYWPNSLVKKLSDLDVLVKIYGQKMDFDFFNKNLISSKIKNGPKIHFLLWKSKFWDHFCFFNFKSWRNKSGLRILIFQVKSGFLGHFFIFEEIKIFLKKSKSVFWP